MDLLEEAVAAVVEAAEVERHEAEVELAVVVVQVLAEDKLLDDLASPRPNDSNANAKRNETK